MISAAIDDLLTSSRLSAVLLKAKAVAYLVGSEKLKAWVKYELDGYYGVKWENFPKYREIPMSVRGNLAPVVGRGWQPDMLLATECLGEETHRMMTHRYLPQGVAELEYMAQKNEPFRIEISPTLTQDMARIIYRRSQWSIHSAWQLGMPTSIEGILSATRSKLLDILMEMKMQFGDNIPLLALQSAQQKQAINDIVSNSLPNINAGANSTVQITVGSRNAANTGGALQQNTVNGNSNNQSVSTTQVASLHDLVAQIKRVVDKDPLFDKNREEIDHDIKGIEVQLQKPEPKAGVLKRAFESLKELASDSAGAATGHAVFELLKQAPDLLVAAGLG